MIHDRSRIEQIEIDDILKKAYLEYSMSVIVSRALPDVRDGLKPSQRRILYAMHELKLEPGKGFRKCAKIAGDTSGNYHPHGEQVVYPTLVRMAQPWSLRYILINGQETSALRMVTRQQQCVTQNLDCSMRQLTLWLIWIKIL